MNLRIHLHILIIHVYYLFIKPNWQGRKVSRHLNPIDPPQAHSRPQFVQVHSGQDQGGPEDN